MKRILIVDDEKSITFSLSRCLESQEVQVVCCNDSHSASKVLSDPVDAVIADVQLSRANPGEAVDLVHSVRSKYSTIPLIMMSCTEDWKERVMHEGANYFFQKPVDVDELAQLLRTLGIEVACSQNASSGT